MIKKLFNLKGGRFIDIYGRPWHKNNVFDRVKPFYYINTGVHLAVLFGAAASAPELLPQLSILVAKNFMGLSLVYTFTEHLLYGTPSRASSITQHAIDREGRTFPPQDQASLLSDVNFATTMNMAALGGVVLGLSLNKDSVGPLTNMIESMGGLPNLSENMQAHPVLYKYAPRAAQYAFAFTLAANAYRGIQLLKGKYVFCGTPPAAPNTQKVSKIAKVFGIAPKY